MADSKYILRHINEAERLNQQAELPAYCISDELAEIPAIPEGSRILDAGCGSGALLKHLSESKPSYQLQALKRDRLNNFDATGM